MSEKINSSNYEAFYLDYLEGTLNAEDTRALLLFLRAHPELQVDEEPLPTLTPTMTLDTDFKAGLKVFDETAVVSEHNAEMFMIASVEESLSPAKQAELDTYVQQHPAAQRDYALYQHTRLASDPSVIYPNKSSLKRGRVIPMYARWSAAAACAVLAVGLWSLFPATSPVSETNSFVQAHFKGLPFRLNQAQTDQQHLVAQQVAVAGDFQRDPVRGNRQQTEILSLKTKQAPTLEVSQSFTKPQALNLSTNRVKQTQPKNVDIRPDNSYTAVQEMKNPIEGITKTIRNRFNKDVDFRTAKAANGKNGGFYLKIGRLEISRKVSNASELASN